MLSFRRMISLFIICIMEIYLRRKRKKLSKLCFILICVVLLFNYLEFMLCDLKEKIKYKYLGL